MTEEIPALPDSCWPVDWGCADQAWLDALDPAVQDRSAAMATQVLRALTGYQVGGCPITVRPCSFGCGGGSYTQAPLTGSNAGALGVQVGPWWAQLDVDGQWINTSCGCTTDCSCSYVPEVLLPAPVGGIVAVFVDGVELPGTSYRVDNGNRLVRTDGLAWPRCQDLTAGPTEPGAFSVTLFNNVRPDGLGAWVAGIMAVEFAKSCTGGKCRLPSGVQSIARLGVSMEIPSGLFENGLTGIREVDMWVRVWNPYQLRTPAQVWSPDLHKARLTTGGQVVWP